MKLGSEHESYLPLTGLPSLPSRAFSQPVREPDGTCDCFVYLGTLHLPGMPRASSHFICYIPCHPPCTKLACGVRATNDTCEERAWAC